MIMLTTAFTRGEDYVDFAPDQNRMSRCNSTNGLLQFMQAGKDKVAVPTTVHAIT